MHLINFFNTCTDDFYKGSKALIHALSLCKQYQNRMILNNTILKGQCLLEITIINLIIFGG